MYYEQIDRQEYLSYIKSHQHLFLDDGEKLLFSNHPRYKYRPLHERDFLIYMLEFEGRQPYYMIVVDGGGVIFINKMEDEWYYVQLTTGADNALYIGKDEFFKIDQFEGLQKFLDDSFTDEFFTKNLKESNVIKLFEEYNQYYIDIEEKIFNNIISDMVDNYPDRAERSQAESFTSREISSVKDVLPEAKPENYNNCIYIDADNGTALSYIKSIMILKLRDEYFLLRKQVIIPDKGREDKYYKCDQLDGLIKCIKDIW